MSGSSSERQTALETHTADGETAPIGPRSGEATPERIGDYLIEAELGQGGMGVVYRARHEQLGREVAVKILRAGRRATSTQRERFRLEGLAAARLRHPNLVAIHDVGEDQNGSPFLVMDLVAGESLEEILGRDGPLGARRAAEVCQGVAEALECAHGHMILHRDVKPANIILSEAGDPLLTDFGLAKDLEDPASGPTQSGQVLGTPAYMSPEQADRGLLDARTDVYGLGATLYALLTGHPPFEGDTLLEVLARVVDAEPEPPSTRRAGIDADLETICLTCLEKEPRHRYVSAAALAEDLARYLAGQSIAARPPGLLRREWDALRKNRRTSPVTNVVLVAFGLIFAGVLWAHFRSVRHTLAITRLDSRSIATRASAAEDLGREAFQSGREALLLAARADEARQVRMAALRSLEQTIPNGSRSPQEVDQMLMIVGRAERSAEERAVAWRVLRLAAVKYGSPPAGEDLAAWRAWWKERRARR